MSSRKVLKFGAILISSAILILYFIFLISPFFLNGIIAKYNEDIVKLVKDSTGLNIVLDDITFVTTPKLTAGIKLGRTEIMLPNNEPILFADNFEVKLSLLPLLVKKIELDKVSVNNAKVKLSVKKDGHFLIEDYIKTDLSANEEDNNVVAELPFGFKLSNHLPNVYLKKFYIAFVDLPTDKKYYLAGSYFNITDFILNKKVKIDAAGEIFFDGEKHFTYDVKLKNYIMPNLDLNDLLLSQNTAEEIKVAETQKKADNFNIIDIFNKIHNNKLSANLRADIKTYGKLNDVRYKGDFTIDGMTVAVDGEKLPEGSIVAELNDKKVKISADLYPAVDEKISILSNFKTGKKPSYDVHMTANAGIGNLINLLDSVSKSFGINDFDTLSGTGDINAEFSIVGNTKKVESSGYLKVPEAKIKYGLYNIAIDNINADVDFSDNKLDIKNISFYVLNQPLKFYGTIDTKANADLYLIADKLPIKALLAALGQIQIIKENDFKSGTLSLEATLKGRLNDPVPAVNLALENLKVKNMPSDTTLSLVNGNLNLTTENSLYEGVLSITSSIIENPLFKIKAPAAKITMDENDIIIDSAYLMVDNSRIDISGGINDYMSKDICIDISAKGNLQANDLRNMIPAEFKSFVTAKGTLPLALYLTGNDKMQKIDLSLNSTPDNYLKILDIEAIKNRPSSIKSSLIYSNDSLKIQDTSLTSEGNSLIQMNGSIDNLSKSQKLSINLNVPQILKMPVPGFRDDSSISVMGNLILGGTALNPTMKGNIEVPYLSIPEMKFSMENLSANLSGAIANGKATLDKMTSGGIVAENLNSDFSYSLQNGIFYLKNISGNAFAGNVSGNIAYNLMNGKIGIDFKGSGMDAIKAIEGAAGIKNALSGTLGFTVNSTLSGSTDVEMIKNLKGKMSFEVNEGAFLSIGKLENLLAADNIVKNVVMRTALAAVSTIPVVKNSANFQYIKGDMTFNNGWAENLTIKTSGPSMAYYITGKYNILNGTANLVILGRMGSDVVGALGPLGELSVDKLTSYIPKFGALTSSIIKTMTSSPQNENIDAIPDLSSGNAQYKDFKVLFNGGIDSESSVKSFKWLSNPDLSEIEGASLKEQIQNSAENIRQTIKTNIETAKEQNQQKQEALKEQAQQFKDQTQQAKEDLKNQVQNVKDSVDEIKNLFKF